MALYELTSAGALTSVPPTTFAAEQVLERADLQRALRDHIDVLDPDLLVVAEEFGDFDVKRRIDLLCVDRTGCLVVVELKRTEDGGHAELQALRYAAMVSAMTFNQLAETYQRHLTAVAPHRTDNARTELIDWLKAAGGADTVLDRRVRIILASAGFDTQITTTVLWLNDVHGLDITCVRLTPYRVDGKLLIDAVQIVPLPEAAEFTVQLLKRNAAAHAAQTGGGNDLTQYAIITPDHTTKPLAKRRAILALIIALHEADIPLDIIAKTLPGWARLLPVDGVHDQDTIETAFIATYPKQANHLHRWFLDHPLTSDGQTWVFSKMWGLDTPAALDALLELAPTPGYDYQPA